MSLFCGVEDSFQRRKERLQGYVWVDHMKIRKNSGIENSHIFNLEGTADKILDFFLRRKRVLAKYT